MSQIVIVTGSAGLIGSESVRFFASQGFSVIGIDNDMRAYFFGESASTQWNRNLLQEQYGDRYIHYNIDIRNREDVENLYQQYSSHIILTIHTAAQPSHDWAANEPHTDFTVNANGTLVLLEATRLYAPNSVFIFTSTNKVYGDTPNFLPLLEHNLRWEIEESHPYYQGIDESMSIDYSKHSLFGASKVAADILVQEYGKYFNMKTASFRGYQLKAKTLIQRGSQPARVSADLTVHFIPPYVGSRFRGGCLTGPMHSGAKLHGFLAYLMKCTITGDPYTIFGYKGKQVRDNIHSYDLVNAFYHFYQNPRMGEVYNIGGSRHSNCSMLEAIEICQSLASRKLNYSYAEDNRIGDHIWYISNVKKFQSHYPEWEYKYSLNLILEEMYEFQVSRS